MKLPRMRIKIRQLVEAVAVVAVLIPFPVGALVFLIGTFAVWVCPPIILIWLCDKVGGGCLAWIASAIIVGVASFFLPEPYFWGVRSFWWVVIPLTSLHLSGMPYAAWRLWRAKLLVSGEILWAWLGLVWLMQMVNPFLRRSHGWIVRLEILVECARLTLVLAGFLLIYGMRPAKPRQAWAHYLGWGLAECDVLLEGWFANPYF